MNSKFKGLLVIVAALAVAIYVATVSPLYSQTATAPTAAPKVPAGSITLEGFGSAEEIRFDESTGGTRPTPMINKSWKLIGVSNGEKQNSNNLWFQDSAGNVYLVHGFTTHGQFIADPGVQVLRAK